MNTKTTKLAHKLGDEDLAEALVKAGFDNPAKLRAASDKALRDAVGQGNLDKVRAKYRRR